MSQFELEDQLLITSVKTIQTLFAEENGADAVALYFFYYQTAKRQKTDQIWATRSYCLKGLHWGPRRFMAAKQTLEKYNLIEVLKGGKANDKWYIKISFVKSKKYQNTQVQSEPKKYQNELVHSDTTNALDKRQSINAFTFTNVKEDAPPKGRSSCPLLVFPLKEKWPKGHIECVEYITAFRFVNKPKQFKFLHQMLRSGLDFPDIDRIIGRVKRKDYFQENGWDFATLAGEADRRANAIAAG